MTNMTASTASEKKLVKAIQDAIGAAQDGVLGPASAVDLAGKVGANCWPLTIKLYGMPCIISKNIKAFNPGKGCSAYANSMSGSFSYQKKPCSILVSGGKTAYGASCHAWLGQPETVLYRLKDGSHGVQRTMSVSTLPEGIEWAVGGLGLMDMWDPAAEGFTGTYADVLRSTNHTVLGIKNGLVYGVLCKSMTGAQVNAFVRDKLKLEKAIMLDGGHVAAMNGAESFARVNTGQAQYYLIQFTT